MGHFRKCADSLSTTLAYPSPNADNSNQTLPNPIFLLKFAA